jgi:hypothetical protein
LVLAMLAKAPESRPADREVAEALAGISANTDGF